MYSKTRPRKKSKAGSVRVKSSNERLQLVFTFGGKRFYISTGLNDTPFNRVKAQEKALEVQRDIELGLFEPDNLTKYQVKSVLTTVDAATPISTPIPNIREIWSQYAETRRPGKSPATVRMYEWVSNHLDRCPYIVLVEAQKIFDWLSSHVPAESCKRVLIQLSAACRWAKRSDLIPDNPFDGMAATIKVKKTGTEDLEVHPFTAEERDLIIEAFRVSPYYSYYAPLTEFLFFTGCRPSEAIALQWKDISPDLRFVTFKRSVVYAGKQGLVLKEGLKTQASRRFPINGQLASLLKQMKPTEQYQVDTLVFPSKTGKFIDWHNYTNRAWKSVLASLPTIEYRNPYQTRHTFCSLCRAANIPSTQLAKWVGNSAQMIDRVYARPLDQIQVPEL